MLLQATPQVRGQDRPVQRRVVVQPSVPATPRSYAPIVLPAPSLGQAVARGLGGILRSTLLLVVFATALITSAMLVAVVIGRVIAALGFQPWAAY